MDDSNSATIFQKSVPKIFTIYLLQFITNLKWSNSCKSLAKPNQIKNLIITSALKQQEEKDPNDVIMRHVEPDDNRDANYTSTGTSETESTGPNQNNYQHISIAS